MKTKIIAFVNFKGGVGKTSNVVNLSACLSMYHKKRVLVVDLDPQSNTTFWLLKKKHYARLMASPSKTVSQIFDDAIFDIDVFDFEKTVFYDVPRTDNDLSFFEGLDLLPASADLLRIDDELHLPKFAKTFYTILSATLSPHISGYDYVFLDCPPNLFFITKNALYFADYYVVPYIPDYLSLSGLTIFCQLIDRFQKSYGSFRANPLNPKIIGVIVNKYKKIGNVFDKSINELKLQLSDLKKQNLIHPSADMFDTPIRDCVRVAECSNYHLPVIVYNDGSIGANDYLSLSMDFLNRMEEVV